MDLSIAMARKALLLYALRAATPETTSAVSEVTTRRASGSGHLTILLDTPCRTRLSDWRRFWRVPRSDRPCQEITLLINSNTKHQICPKGGQPPGAELHKIVYLTRQPILQALPYRGFFDIGHLAMHAPPFLYLVRLFIPLTSCCKLSFSHQKSHLHNAV
jgi:hypothetical protein